MFINPFKRKTATAATSCLALSDTGNCIQLVAELRLLGVTFNIDFAARCDIQYRLKLVYTIVKSKNINLKNDRCHKIILAHLLTVLHADMSSRLLCCQS